MIRSEANVQADLTQKNGGQNIDTGVWVEQFVPTLPASMSAYGGGSDMASSSGFTQPIVPRYRGVDPRQQAVLAAQAQQLRELQIELAKLKGEKAPPAAPTPSPVVPAPGAERGRPGAAASAPTEAITNITMICRLVDRRQFSPSANTDLAFAVKANLNATNTFTFELTVGLKHPFKL
jgi:hypothetical protein